jgi:aminopeptidase
MTDIPMTDAECAIAMRQLEGRMHLYAELLVRRGVAIQQGQELVLTAPVEAAAFVRIVVAEAYKAGAGHVTVLWGDDELSRLEYDNCPLERFQTLPEWKAEQMNSLARAGAAFLWLDGEDPDVMLNVDPAKPAARAVASHRQCTDYRRGLDFGENAWCIGGVPVAAWAKKVFPGLSAAEATYRLWVAILDTARVVDDDPTNAWETHDATLAKNKRRLNEGHFDALHYTSENGTDLIVGLPEGHLWEGGSARTKAGVSFFPNIPTEEVFTSPDRNRADGIVHSALPLVHNGAVISNFWVRFEGGRVVDFGAERGEDVLRSIIETDEGSHHLGECALISKNTPIRQSGLLFYNTLYDENASCHLALGMGFPDCYQGGVDMDKESLLAVGVNESAQHVDFMIGADDLDVTGIKADGTEVPIFVHGQWSWE